MASLFLHPSMNDKICVNCVFDNHVDDEAHHYNLFVSRSVSLSLYLHRLIWNRRGRCTLSLICRDPPLRVRSAAHTEDTAETPRTRTRTRTERNGEITHRA